MPKIISTAETSRQSILKNRRILLIIAAIVVGLAAVVGMGALGYRWLAKKPAPAPAAVKLPEYPTSSLDRREYVKQKTGQSVAEIEKSGVASTTFKDFVTAEAAAKLFAAEGKWKLAAESYAQADRFGSIQKTPAFYAEYSLACYRNNQKEESDRVAEKGRQLLRDGKGSEAEKTLFLDEYNWQITSGRQG